MHAPASRTVDLRSRLALRQRASLGVPLSPLWRRVLAMPPLVLAISFIAFALINLAPSDPAEVSLRLNAVVPTDEAIALVRQELGLDQPFLARYLHWLWDIAHLDFGRSFLTRHAVLDDILLAVPPTLYLAGVTLSFILVMSILLSLLCLVFRDTWVDGAVRGVVFVLMAMPNYWLALLLIWALSVQLGWFPVSGMRTYDAVILPAFVLSLAYVGFYVRLIRGTMRAQLAQPYVFYARARGLPEKTILVRHVLRNSLHSALIGIGMSIPKLLAGTVVIENIFAWPGIGRLGIGAVFGRDYPVIQAYVLLMAILFLLFNFIADLLQQALDPRVRNF